MRVLVTAAGSANGISTIIALQRAGHQVHACDSELLSAGLYLCDSMSIVPKTSNASEYIKEIIHIVNKNYIEAIIPIYSKEIPIFAANKHIIESKTSIKLCIPSIEIISKLNDKYLFYKFLVDNFVATPHTMLLNDFLSGDMHGKFVIKDRLSAGSHLVWIIANAGDFVDFMRRHASEPDAGTRYIVQRFVEGNEYTVDFCCDFKGRFLGCVIRERLEVRDGKCTKARTIVNESIREQVKTLLESIRFVGPGNLQGIINADGLFQFIELNPRFAAGGLPLTIEVGFNIPDIVVKMCADPNGTMPEFKSYKANRTMLRFYTETFVDSESFK